MCIIFRKYKTHAVANFIKIEFLIKLDSHLKYFISGVKEFVERDTFNSEEGFFKISKLRDIKLI